MDDSVAKEYAVKNKDGKFKIWQQGKLIDYQQWLASKVSATKDKKTTAIIDTGMEEPLLAPPAPMVVKQPTKFALEKIVKKLVDKFSLQLDKETEQRLGRILLSYFRGARKTVDLRVSLQGDWQSGDLNLKNLDIDSFLRTVKEIDQQIKDNGGEVISLEIDVNKLKNKPIIAQKIDDAKQAAKEEIKERIDKQSVILKQVKQASENSIANIGKNLDKDRGFKNTKIRSFGKKNLSWKQRSHLAPDGKVSMNEVKSFDRLVGPVDELRQLDLNTFRLLGDSPGAIVNRIKERIDALSGDLVVDQDKAIRAWQSSPVYSLYVKLGRLSLDEGFPVETIIKQQINAGQLSLSIMEFEAISDLNAKFRF